MPTVLQTVPFGHSGNLPCDAVPQVRRLLGLGDDKEYPGPAVARTDPAGRPRDTSPTPNDPAQHEETPMPADASFDIVSTYDRQEVDNALNQASKEISQRYDFKNTGASIDWHGAEAIEVTANADERAKAVVDVFREKLIKRGLSLKVLDVGEPHQSGKDVKIDVTLKKGITQEQAKKLSALVRDQGPKAVKVQIQGDELRVTGKKRDDLQEVIALVKGQELDFAVQFTNYR
jgi:uncharacterized protein YajQ (UPF0234 family)